MGGKVPAIRRPGVSAALGSALLFGAGTPLAKSLLQDTDPWLLAGLLYFGAGIGLAAWRAARRAPRGRLPRADVPWLVAAVACGGMLAPVLLMAGLAGMPATGASLLLNAEGVLTALIAWIVFRENVDRKVAAGMGLIVAGAVVLSWPGQGAHFAGAWPAAAVLGACLLWAVDNNLTRRVAFADATWVAMVKGITAGTANLALAVGVRGQPLPGAAVATGALAVGFAAYGVSLVLFVVGLRSLGTARTGAYFSVAPFFGAALAVGLLGEPLTPRLLAAGGLMAAGVWLHLTEQHRHRHSHGPLVHEHPYDPADPHHRGVSAVDGGGASGDRHRHPVVTHAHPHYPDIHHRHGHRGGRTDGPQRPSG